jgi:DNA polymerase III psi subunit
MKSEEKLLKEMGISSWTLKKNFSFDGKHITKKDIKNISSTDIKLLKSLSISLRQEFSENYPEQIIDFLSSKKIEIDNIDFLKNMSAKEKKELLINIEKN